MAWPALAATFNVRDFGATGDGVTKDTAAFQKALDICAVSVGGEVLVPAGKYLIGSVQLGHDTILRLAESKSKPLVRSRGMSVTVQGPFVPPASIATLRVAEIGGRCSGCPVPAIATFKI